MYKNSHNLSIWWLSLLALAGALIALPARAQTDQALAGRVFTDLNTNGRHDYGEPYRANILVEARHINSEIRSVWTDTSTQTGDYHLLLWDPGSYDLKAYCEHQTGNLSSMSVCWRTPTSAPVQINGSGKSLDIPLPPSRLYLPIARAVADRVQSATVLTNTLTATAFFDLDGNGSQSATEAGAANINIVATNTITPSIQAVGRTDAAGVAVLPITVAGRYAVAA